MHAQVIKNHELSPLKSSGPNGIPTDILQMSSNIICAPLSKIYNISVLSGSHPEKLKHANIIPIFKKGSRLLVSNYRPISLLSNLNKIFEKIISKRVSSFLEKFNILYELQFGFRSKYSTNHALIHMTEKIRAAIDSGKVTGGVFIDLQKAVFPNGSFFPGPVLLRDLFGIWVPFRSFF